MVSMVQASPSSVYQLPVSIFRCFLSIHYKLFNYDYGNTVDCDDIHYTNGTSLNNHNKHNPHRYHNQLSMF